MKFDSNGITLAWNKSPMENNKEHQILLDFIHSQDGVTQEYPLLRHINDQHAEFFEPLGLSPSLFKKHFYLFHQLHLLNTSLLEKNLRLIISPLEIRICPVTGSGQGISETDVLKSFYLDANNLNMTDEEVNEMQKKFWEKYFALDKKAEAIKVLGLEKEENLDKRLLKRRFNELAQKHHPDKGGDSEQFHKIQDAYESLKQLVKS